MCGGSILSCCPRNPHGHEWALKEEEDLIVVTTKTSFTVYSAVGTGDAEDNAASPWEVFLGKFEQNLSKIWAKVIKIWANLIRIGQNQNLASQKHWISSDVRLYRFDFSKIGFFIIMKMLTDSTM